MTIPVTWVLRPATHEDVEPLAEIRAVVMRPDLERLGRYDEHRVRQRFRDAFTTEDTRIIEIDGAPAGCVALKTRTDDGTWLLEHFYLAPEHQGHGIGAAVLALLLARADRAGAAVRLVVLQGSRARTLYERFGFTHAGEDPVDVFMLRASAPPSMSPPPPLSVR